MSPIPQLTADDASFIEAHLQELVGKAGATEALLTDMAGFLIAHQGSATDFDLTSIAALGSGAFMANQSIAGLIQDDSFKTIYQQGGSFSVLAMSIDENLLLLIIFNSSRPVGSIKFFALHAAKAIAKRMELAAARPAQPMDMSGFDPTTEGGSLFARQ